jgi:ATP-binding cassette subfamily C protein
MFRSVLSIFFRAPGTHPWAVLACLLAASLAGGLGLSSLLPLLSIAAGSGQESDSPVAQAVLQVLSFLGLQPKILPLLLFLSGGIIVRSLLTLLAMSYAGSTMARVATGLRSDLIKQLLRVRWSYLASQPMGRFANAVSVDATRAGRAYLVSANFMSNALQALIYLGVAFFISWQLSLLALITGLIIAGLLHVFVGISRRAGLRQTQRTGELVTYLTDALNSIKPLKAMARQDGFARLFDRKIRSLRKALLRQVLSKEARRALEQILTALCVAVVFYAAVDLWNYKISEVVVMGVLLLQTLANIGKVQGFLQEAAVLESPYIAIRELIDEATEAREYLGDGREPSLDESVRLQAVDFSFAGQPVLKGIDLEVSRGEILVLTGPSGAGKTTITDLILGLHEPDRGAVLVDGVPLPELNRASWRRMIGYVPQELILFHDTVYANVALGDEAITETDAQAALVAAGAWDFVSAHPDGMMAVVGEKGAKLSGGQRQRIALARALATRPRLLILDEVTSALDPDTEKDLCRRLGDLTKDMAVLAITHRLSLLDIADRVYRLEEGTLTEVVTPAAASLAQPA